VGVGNHTVCKHSYYYYYYYYYYYSLGMNAEMVGRRHM